MRIIFGRMSTNFEKYRTFHQTTVWNSECKFYTFLLSLSTNLKLLIILSTELKHLISLANLCSCSHI